MSGSAADLPIPNVWCVGRNYAEHIKELGNSTDAPAENPMIFLKSGSSILASGQPLVLPSWSSDIHHEIELAVQLGPDLQPVRAAVALDLTLRDVQAKLKKAQHPWTLAKSFKCSAPLGSFFSLMPASNTSSTSINLQDLELVLTVNGITRQHGHTSHMLFSVDTLLRYVRERFPVMPGDLVLTGTPHGVSALREGDVVEAKVVSKGSVLSQGTWTAVREVQQ